MKVRDKTFDQLTEIYEKYGYKKLLSNSIHLLKETEKGKEKRVQKNDIKGELGEIVAFCNLIEIQKKLKFKTFIKKGLFIQNSDGKVTECDLVFVTPIRIYIIECKSYSGNNKVAKGKCELWRGNELIKDVWEQNKIHTLIFNEVFGSLTAINSKPYKMILFDFATNKFIDKREGKYKSVMPILNENTFEKYILNDLKERIKNQVCVDVRKMEIRLTSGNASNQQYLKQEHKRQLKY